MTRVERNTAFLRNIYLKGPFQGHAFMSHPPGKPPEERPLGDYTLSDRPVTDWVPQIIERYELEQHWLDALDDHAVPMASLGCATHLYAAAFGCPVHDFEGSNPAAQPLVGIAEEADALAEPDIWSSPTLYRVFELGDALRKELGEDVYLGPPDLQTGFDSAALVWNKADFMQAMVLQPDAVRRLVTKCASLLNRFLVELRREFPSLVPGHCPRAWVPPELGFWVSNDECGSISTPMFRTFCLPEMVELSATFGSLGMHCCADAEHQFEAFKEIPNFYAFNRVPGYRGWEPLLDHFDGPDAPVHVLGWQSVETVVYLLSRASAGTRFIFVHHAQSLEDARIWLDQVRALADRAS